jgi:thymidylate synthase
METSDNVNVILGSDLSSAWAKVFCKVYEHTNSEISPLLVTFPYTDLASIEQSSIYMNLDEELLLHKSNSINTIANTIFPISLWNSNKNRKILFERYQKNLRHILKDRRNSKGVYFQRLIAFQTNDAEPVNQLEHIITTWNGNNHRRSALQAQIFNPYTDHSHARILGFPCLDQIVFNVTGNTLKITGVYAMQYIFDKALGNYLGLARLGKFMAHEMNLELSEISCIACTAKLSDKTKGKLKDFYIQLSASIGGVNGG